MVEQNNDFIKDKTNGELVNSWVFDKKEWDEKKLEQETEKAINEKVEASFQDFLKKNKDKFDNIFNFAYKNNIAVTNFNPLIPMPGTKIYDRMEKEGRLIYKKRWLSDKYRYGDTAYIPANMTPEDLRQGCLRIRTKFYSVPSILKRLFANKANFTPMNLFVFLLINFISRREIRSKQGQMLGGILGETDAD